jgi:unconventional prefoldin RPB5 interactor 1
VKSACILSILHISKKFTIMDESALARVEAQRIELEANIANLRKSLRYWQALDVDYQGLSEEFLARPENLSKAESLKIAQEYGADVVDEKELRELLNYDKGVPRRPEQIIELLSKRVEYVNRNVDTIKKQLADAQKKLNALLLAEQPDFRDDAGLPLTEITEELDEDGNVVSSKVQGSDEASPRLAEVLAKAGVRDVEQVEGRIVAKDSMKEPTRTEPVSSAPGISLEAHHDANNIPAIVVSQPVTTEASAAILEKTSVPGETAEEAALRAEMLQYHQGLDEVGAIVAELDLEEGDVAYGEDDDDDLLVDSDYDEDEDLEDESEDEKGMSRSSLQSEAYLRKMRLLEKKHGITGMSNLGPKPDLPSGIESQLNRPSPAEAARKAALARAENAAKSETSKKEVEEKPAKAKAKKKVAFANTLDIAAENASANLKRTEIPKAPVTITAAPFKQSIVERPAKELVSSSTEPPTKKVSRFRAARSSTPQTPMFAPDTTDTTNPTSKTTEDSRSGSGPIGKISEPTIIEHPSSKTDVPPPNGSSDVFGIDDAMHQREIATEYHQLRNRMIQRQGGFVGEGEQNNWGDATAPLDVEDENGKTRKVSRFKAARMK